MKRTSQRSPRARGCAAPSRRKPLPAEDRKLAAGDGHARANGAPGTNGVPGPNGTPPAPSVAKKCPTCGAAFTRKDLIEARSITPIGMLHMEGEPASSAIYCFTHTPWTCRTTFGLPVETFRDEIAEDIPETFLNGTDACGGHCSRLEDLEECHSACTLAPYRRFLLQKLVRRRR